MCDKPSPSVNFEASRGKRKVSKHRKQRSEQFSPYPQPDLSGLDSPSGLPMPNFNALETFRRSKFTHTTPEAPKKNGRHNTPANRSFSSPCTSLFEDFDLKALQGGNVEFSGNKDFENGELIGTGSQGDVYKAFHKTEQKYYAIKVLKRINLNEKQRNKLKLEIDNVQIVSPHQHLLSYVSVWEVEGEVFLQMELCKESLDQYLRNRNSPLEEEKIWDFFTDITLGIHKLHTNNFIHRDIKPANIFFDAQHENLLRIGDFGLLINADSDDTTEGDCRYLAAEAVDERSSFKSDIFSLGITILEATCLQDMPQSGDLWDKLRGGEQSLRSTNIIPSYYSEDLKRILAAMLDPIPENRPSTEDILALHQVQLSLTRRNQIDIDTTQNLEDNVMNTYSNCTTVTLRTRTAHRVRSRSSPNCKSRPARSLFPS